MDIVISNPVGVMLSRRGVIITNAHQHSANTSYYWALHKDWAHHIRILLGVVISAFAPLFIAMLSKSYRLPGIYYF